MYVYRLAAYTVKDDLALPILLALTLKELQTKHTMLIFTFKYSTDNQILHVMQAACMNQYFFSITNYKVNLSTRSKPSI